MVSRSDLIKVYFDNIRDNQIGGQTDGISEEVARDLGYSANPDDFKADTQGVETSLEIDARSNSYWPTPKQRAIGRAAIKEIRDRHDL